NDIIDSKYIIWIDGNDVYFEMFLSNLLFLLQKVSSNLKMSFTRLVSLFDSRAVQL
ncbi:hypothetical protein MHK_003634, partial [Candidatus Magnetomorum sp. HK-1]